MSLVDLETPHPIIPARRPHEPHEIIDVDSLDIVDVGSQPPRQRRRVAEDGRSVPVSREVIQILDSDDEQEVEIIRHIPPQPHPHRTDRRARIFSPPPPPQMDAIPPVPPIPQRYLPMRHRPPPFPTADGLVIANEQPLPFELELERPRRPANPPVGVPPPAAPPSHHVPAMGFGGALLAGVRNIMHGRGNRHGHAERQLGHHSWGFPGVIVRWDPFDILAAEDAALHGFGLPYSDDELDIPFGAHRVRRELEHAFERRGGQHQSEPDYKPEYTHPDKPSPGFTHDFAPPSPSPTSPAGVIDVDNSPGPSKPNSTNSRSGESILACAHCHDPLVLGALDVAEGRDQRRLWGLRCGHLVDGKCIDKLMKPLTPVSGNFQNHAHVDIKGKGKMMTEIPDALPSSSGQDDTMENSIAALNPMRSRLRPRRHLPGSFPGVPFPGHPSPPGTRTTGRYHDHLGGPVGRHHRGKGKGKAVAPIVEAEYEWGCPVGGCGRVHYSLFVDGRWKMDEKRGAIAVFV